MEIVAESRDYSGVTSIKQKNRPVTLRFISGLHAGAAHNIHDGEWLLLGAAEDCDLLLGDLGIAAYHCLIGVMQSRLCIRSLEAEVQWNDINIPAGNVRTVSPLGELKMGETQIQFSSQIKRRALLPPVLRHYVWVALSLLLSTSATYVMAVSLFGSEVSDHASADLKNIDLHTEDLQKKEKAAQEEGRRMAASLRDIMRLSGIEAETRFQEDGTVDVIGYFGDGKSVANAVQSRAVREIRGLKRVQVVNKSIVEDVRVPDAPLNMPASDTKMVKIIFGSDPYLVVTDGSRYYPGARLPNGYSLVSILDKEAVLVETESGEETLMSVHELF